MTDTMDHYEEPVRIAGRRGARESHEESLLITKFVKATIAPGTYVEWDGSGGIKNFGMDNNGPDPTNPSYYPNGCGNCGEAAPDHGNMVKADNPALYQTFGQPKFANGLATYFAYGVSQGEQGQPPAPIDAPDEGVDNASWLAFLYKAGVIKGYAEVPVDQMDAYAPEAHGLLIGQSLPDSAESDFEATPPIPWGQPNEVPDQQEGHDTWYIQGHVDGSGGLITWGAIQPFTLRYRLNFITDAWLVWTIDDPAEVSPELQAALDALHGTVQPPAANGDTPPAPTEESFVQRVEHDVEEVVEKAEGWWRQHGSNAKAPVRPDSQV